MAPLDATDRTASLARWTRSPMPDTRETGGGWLRIRGTQRGSRSYSRASRPRNRIAGSTSRRHRLLIQGIRSTMCDGTRMRPKFRTSRCRQRTCVEPDFVSATSAGRESCQRPQGPIGVPPDHRIGRRLSGSGHIADAGIQADVVPEWIAMTLNLPRHPSARGARPIVRRQNYQNYVTIALTGLARSTPVRR